MARGLPALWSTLLSLPFVGAGIGLFLGVTRYSPITGGPLVVFGVFIFLVGLYIHFVAAPEPPELHDDEMIVDERYPSQRVAASKLLLAIPLLALAAYLYGFTLVPYVYPTVAFLLGLYFFSTGLRSYWANTLTTYYVTTERIISEYRFLALARKELPLDKIRGVEERKTVLETLAGLGNIRVASGGGGGSVEMVMRNMGESTAFADEIRNAMR